MSAALARRVRFGRFEADLASGELWRDGAAVPLQDLPFRLLAALLDRPGDVVSRADLAARLWGADTFVDATAGLNTAVAKLREALGDDPDRPVFVETLPKRGYRFVAVVAAVEPVVDAPVRAAVAPAPAIAAVDAVDAVAVPGAAAVVAPGPRRRWIRAAALVAVVVVAGVAWAAYAAWTADGPVRVAVVLFDNETGRPELAPFAQAMTDATVAGLAAEPRLAVIGNAAVLRTARPFRDVAAVRDALGARFIVIGQVQWRDDGVLVRTHLIRGWDQAHLWIDAYPRGSSSEADFQARVAAGVRRAVVAQVR
jgi:DNA-binding winged helix-turn-helix (wHTH) protein/TolB-like protein